MAALRVLHITNWYAEPRAPQRVPFIAEHVAALAPDVIQQLWHVEVQEGAWAVRWQHSHRGFHGQALILAAPLASWQLREWLTLLLLVLLRIRLWRGRWDLVVVHIAYPLLRFPRLVQLLVGRRLLLIEHWSAYHTNFQLPPASAALRRLQGMFATGIPVVAVSQALAADIRRFAGRPDLPVAVVPNAVDTSLFCPDPQRPPPPSPTFLMVASWAPIKRPLLVLAAIRALLPQWPQLRLRVIGGGELLPAMQAYIASHGLSEAVQLLGPQPKPRIASELRSSTALLHPSAYETFSVVCAEALCCGVPVLASAVGALPELITPDTGRLVANTPEAWTAALRQWLTHPPAWNHAAIAEQAAARFSRQAVGRQLLQVAERAARRP
jgi:glycosyltransferase involved in cell wall biosynthesis